MAASVSTSTSLSRKYKDYCRGENPLVDTAAIRIAMCRCGYSQKALADELDLSYTGLRHKLKWGNWTVLEAEVLGSLLHLDIMTVFFGRGGAHDAK